MGGLGSGRSSSSILMTVDECRAIDVNYLNREGLLAAGNWGKLQWIRDDNNSEDDEVVASVGIAATTLRDGQDAIRIFYTVTDAFTDAPRSVDYHVPLEYTECHFGGERPWFRCPGEGCSERVGKLYRRLRANRFLCRHCHELVYESAYRSDEFFFENITRPADREQEAIDQLADGPITREDLREVYEAKRAAREGLDAFVEHSPPLHSDDPLDDPHVDPLPPFEEWLDELIQPLLGRPYGRFGRCEATAKSTGERCRQPATGAHGKCYYHGGGPGSGAPEGNQNAATGAD